MQHLSKNIFLLRNLNQQTQGECADTLGFRRTTWTNYESGLSTPPLDVALKIARHFDVNLDDLVTKDLKTDVNLIAKFRDSKFWEKVNVNVNAIVNPNAKYQPDQPVAGGVKTPFNSALKSDQSLIKVLTNQVADLSRKMADLEAYVALKVSTIEDKVTALTRKAPKK